MTRPWAIREFVGRYALARLSADAALPSWIDGEVTCVTRSGDELSILCRDDAVPAGVRAERGFVLFAVVGPIDFSTVGLLASMTQALAEVEISVIAFSTYDTDYLGVRAADRGRARDVLAARGFDFTA